VRRNHGERLARRDFRRGHHGGGVGNAALPRLGSLCGEDEGIEGFKAELEAQIWQAMVWW
jgi:hypothetical protein